MIREAEALEKWCPFSRVAQYGNRRDNNRSPVIDGSLCIGSKCMAWQSGKIENGQRYGQCALMMQPIAFVPE